MDHEPAETHQQATEFLEELGYLITWVGEGTVTCVLRRGHERWLGHGATRREAFDDALACALPSRLGAELLRGALSRRAEEPARDEPVEAAVESVPRPPELAVVEQPHQGEAEPAIFEEDGADPVEVDAPELRVADPVPELELPRLVSPEPALAGWEGVPEPPRVDARDSKAPADEVIPLDPAEAHARLDGILAAIDRSIPDLATSTAARKRLQITAWMAEARGLEQALSAEEEVRSRVTAMAHRLGGLSRRWWPGTTRILALRSMPAEVSADVLRESCHDWLSLAARVEDVLTAEEPRDVDGEALDWQDDEALLPQPLDVQAQLAEARAAIERILGSLAGDPPDWGEFRARHFITATEEAELVRAAQQLRWLREADVDPEAWASAIGRLRWFRHHRRAPSSALDLTLKRGYRPLRSWAAELGQDPDAKRRRRRLRQLLDECPGSDWGRSELAEWLGEAIDVGGDSLPLRRVASLVHHDRDLVLGFSEDELGVADRGGRRRLRKLHEELLELDEAAAAGERASLVVEMTGAPVDLDEADDQGPGAAIGAELAERLRPRLAGRRALFVSNRKDADVCADLASLLGMEVEGTVASPRRTASACEQIAGGRYDYVLAATGFIGHSTEAALSEACRKSRAALVRTYKARPLSVLRALARDLGVHADMAVDSGQSR